MFCLALESRLVLMRSVEKLTPKQEMFEMRNVQNIPLKLHEYFI